MRKLRKGTRLDRDAALIMAFRKIGSITRTAKLLGLAQNTVSQWDRCPPQHVVALEKLSGISRHRLRPDIFGRKPIGETDARSKQLRPTT